MTVEQESYRERNIIKYMASFGMTRQQAEAFYEKVEAKDAVTRKINRERSTLYWSESLKCHVTFSED